jgi:hypothetical protein
MNKKNYPYLLPTATDHVVSGEFCTKVTPIISGSPYYQSCLKAFGKKGEVVKVPYAASYDTASAMAPCFECEILNLREQCDAKVIVQQAAKPAAEAKPATQRKYYKKRIFILALIFIFSLIALAIPVVSNFALAGDYVDIGVDILDITDIFSAGFSLQALVDNLAILLLALFLIFALILTLKAIAAIIGKKKRGFGIFSLLALIAAAAIVFAGFGFDFQALFASITALDYGIYALIGCPLLVLLLSFLAYRKLS